MLVFLIVDVSCRQSNNSTPFPQLNETLVVAILYESADEAD